LVSAQQLSRRGKRVFTKMAKVTIPPGIRWRIVKWLSGDATAHQPIGREVFPPPGDYDVVSFSIVDWHFRFQRPQQLLKQYGREGVRVFYIGIKFHGDGPDIFVRSLSDRVFELSLPGPTRTNVYQDEIDGEFLEALLASIEALRCKAGIRRAVSFVQLPFWAPLALSARELWGWPVIYDCMDDHEGFSTNSDRMLRHEQGLFSSSDLVVTTSGVLRGKAEQFNSNVVLVPNAADFAHFQHPPRGARLPLPDRPVVGYFGAISEWFDDDLVAEIARARPQWNFVLIGDTFGARLGKLKTLRNVFLLGEQPYAALPGFLWQFDVACIPFLLNRLTHSTNPVKFFEYLSAGKPVVSVRLPELEPYRNFFYAARGPEEFIAQIKRAMGEDNPDFINARMRFAQENTWHHRYSVLRGAIDELMDLSARDRG
jgi:glycosyltransferase involved in cell wall biosynthesis